MSPDALYALSAIATLLLALLLGHLSARVRELEERADILEDPLAGARARARRRAAIDSARDKGNTNGS